MENPHIPTDAMVRIVESKELFFTPDQWQHVRGCEQCSNRFAELVRLNIKKKAEHQKPDADRPRRK